MIKIQHDDFDTARETEALTAGRTDVGALVTFTGLVRDIAIELEHYPAMATRELQALEAEAERRWPLKACLIIHRVGRLEPGARIVLVAAASAHRADAFAAAEFLMDALKTRAPFWKREFHDDGPKWVEAAAKDDAAAARWQKR